MLPHRYAPSDRQSAPFATNAIATMKDFPTRRTAVSRNNPVCHKLFFGLDLVPNVSTVWDQS